MWHEKREPKPLYQLGENLSRGSLYAVQGHLQDVKRDPVSWVGL